MNKINDLTYLFFFITVVGFAQDQLVTQDGQALKELAIAQAQEASDATIAMDFNTVLKYTLPSVVEIMGGKNNALNQIKSQFDKMVADGFVFEKADVIGVADFVYEHGQYRCIIETFNQMKMPNIKITSKSFLFGIYDDEKSWFFVEAKQLKNSEIRDLVLPDFKTSMEIPDDEIKTQPIED